MFGSGSPGVGRCAGRGGLGFAVPCHDVEDLQPVFERYAGLIGIFMDCKGSSCGFLGAAVSRRTAPDFDVLGGHGLPVEHEHRGVYHRTGLLEAAGR